MIDWLLNDVLWRRGRKRVHVVTAVFLGTGLGYCNASTALIWRFIVGKPVKNGGPTDRHTQQFSRGFCTLYPSKGKT